VHLIAAGVLLVFANIFALRIQRRYTHSVLWRVTVERMQSRFPAVALGWQRYDGALRVVNLAGIVVGAALVVVGM
jgi:hypothetical protein